jgi:hypothetical protein
MLILKILWGHDSGFCEKFLLPVRLEELKFCANIKILQILPRTIHIGANRLLAPIFRFYRPFVM